MSSKKLGGFVNETCKVHKVLFLKNLTCVFLCHKDLKMKFAHKKILKNDLNTSTDN